MLPGDRVSTARCITTLVWVVLFWTTLSPRGYAQRGPALVEVIEVEMRKVAPTQATLGTIVPSRRAVIGSAVDGRVDQFKVRVGQRVEKDEALAELLDTTISLEVATAKAEENLRREELAELKNGSLPEEIAQAKARLEAARVVVEFLEKNKQRFVDLGDTRAISVSEYESAISTWLEAQQRYREAQSSYQLAIDGPRAEKINQAQARLDMQTATVERLEDQLAKHTLRTRFAGYVTVEHTEVGQWLPRGEPVAEVIAIDEVDLLAKVPEAYIRFVHVGDDVDVEVPALRRTFTGKVFAVIPDADERSRTFPVKVRITNEQILDLDGKKIFDDEKIPADKMLLKAGMLARALLATDDASEVLMVPKDALVLGEAQPKIWLVMEGSTTASTTQPDMLEADAIAVPVKMGLEDDDWIQVIAEIPAHAMVVVRGNERIPASPPGAPPSRIMWKNKNSSSINPTTPATPTASQ